MAETEEITIVINVDGTVSIDVNGVLGPRCEAVTKALEQGLGGDVLKRQHKDSYHQTADIVQSERQELKE